MSAILFSGPVHYRGTPAHVGTTPTQTRIPSSVVQEVTLSPQPSQDEADALQPEAYSVYLPNRSTT